MTIDENDSSPASETDLAIERALEAANLRAGDALGSTSASVVEEWEQTAAEAGDIAAGVDGDWMSDWTVVAVDDPAVLVRASHLFDEPVSPEGTVDFLRRPGHILLMAASHDGEGIGFVSGVEMRHPDKQAEMFIYELGVDEAWRGRGVAKELISALRDVAVQRGCHGMWTGTEADNVAALATYRSLGATVDDTSVFITWDDLNPGAAAHE